MANVVLVHGLTLHKARFEKYHIAEAFLKTAEAIPFNVASMLHFCATSTPFANLSGLPLIISVIVANAA